MTNGWIDIKNTDMMLIMGGNPAENHPCGFKWAIEAKRQRNAQMIVVDPRFTRTAAVADLFVQIRAGSDIAFLGGLIHYALENQRVAQRVPGQLHQRVVHREGRVQAARRRAVFRASTRRRRPTTSRLGITRRRVALRRAAANAPARACRRERRLRRGARRHPRSRLPASSKHYSRYTPEMVERITGIPRDQFLKAADLFTSIRKDGDTKKVATVIYAVGWTQHTFGTQIIRTAAMLQLLLGNVGRAGGGVNALRGHSNIQGATDMAGIFDNLPGYLKVPASRRQGFRRLDEAHHADAVQARRNGTRGITGRTRRGSPCRC